MASSSKRRVHCRNLLERLGGKGAADSPATDPVPAAHASHVASQPEGSIASVQLTESDRKKTFGAYDVHTETGSVISPELRNADAKTFDVSKMLPAQDTGDGAAGHLPDFQHPQITKTAEELRRDIHKSFDVHRNICPTQTGYKRLFQGEFLLHDRRQFYENAKKRLRKLRNENAGKECHVAEFYGSSLSYDDDDVCTDAY